MSRRKRQIQNLFENSEALQAGAVATALDVSRQTAHRYLRQLVEEDYLTLEGAGRSSRYRRRSLRFVQRFSITGLQEDEAWKDMKQAASFLDGLPPRAEDALYYAFTEIVNNAIDHSSSPYVEVVLSRELKELTLEVIDGGVGIFRHVRDRLGLNSELEALQELSKGKTTTMPDRHSGEGLFFTSKLAQDFEIQSGRLRWVIDNRRRDMAVGELDPPIDGTIVRFMIEVNTVQDLTDVFAEYTDEFKFTKTNTVIRLFAIGTKFVSRSEAKRLLRGLEKFKQVVLDFKGVQMVGQGFTDQVFRVWANDHPEVSLIPTDMNDAVAFMVERAKSH